VNELIAGGIGLRPFLAGQDQNVVMPSAAAAQNCAANPRSWRPSRIDPMAAYQAVIGCRSASPVIGGDDVEDAVK